MKKIELTEGTWYHYVATFGDTFRKRDLTQICGVTKAITAGGLLLLFVAAICAAVTASAGNALAWIVAGIFHHFVQPDHFAELVIVIVVIIGACAIMGLTVLGVNELREKNKGKEPGIIGHIYKSWKDKVCVKVEWKQ